ncbi:hypothetical protein M0208_07470 [Sphingomonas sp. SUN019]|uniref:hypothetical protein n=1 Tax=Sphingomonas sp. SUN019 TaxID=2937788 RepID=UPI00216401BF|nr:hypothetical protein [Sphingomonas sp. SUN019]UVO50367.1 hypothetical protein M0208_07470 [Sphingomonas sp. SUN019]
MEEWHPGSFTKNFSWGPESHGLKVLHEMIRAGFADDIFDVPRAKFRERVRHYGRPDYIALNFFLYNEVRSGVDFVVVDELVFQALNFRHSAHFDRLALFAFNFSNVGRWKSATPFQGRPALWAYHYIADRVGPTFEWDTTRISADDIERFVSDDNRYVGQTTRKLATNLNYLYKIGRLGDYRSPKPERWWLSALFLALDRTVRPDQISTGKLADAALMGELMRSGFGALGGKRSIAKDIATSYFTSLYAVCGGRSRFVEEAVQDRERLLVPGLIPNEPTELGTVGVFHPTNPTARNAIPRICKILAKYSAGFELLDAENLDDFDIEAYIKSQTENALRSLDELGIKPQISSDELIKLTRGE